MPRFRVSLWTGLWGVCLGLCAGAGAACPEAGLTRFESTQPQMGVPFKIILYAADEATAKSAFDAAFSRIAQLDAVMSDYLAESELSRLSRTAGSGQPVRTSGDLWRVLARAQTLAHRTDGAFDVTVGPYVRLWRRARRSGSMPSDARLAAARAAVGFEKLELDEAAQTARLAAPHMRLDLGGIAKGYAVDEALAVLRDRGIRRALIDGSGDVGMGDPPPGRPGWTIDVVPVDLAGAPRLKICLANAAATTSGDAFQHVLIDGKRYSHIVDPRTGLGLTDASGVTVIAGDCTTADSLATAVSVLGPAAGLELVDSIGGAAALVVRAGTGEPETFESRRFRAFVTHDAP